VRTKRDPENKEARLDCLRGCMKSMVFLRFGILPGGSHGIGHQIGPYGVPHGETTCVMLPAVLKYNASVNAKQQSELLDVLWANETVAEVLRELGVKEDGTVDLGDAIDAIVRELGLPRSLKEVGVGKGKFDAIAESSIHDRLCAHNPIPLIRKEQVLEILKMAA
jgi:alcohol dehydrogenase class IV